MILGILGQVFASAGQSTGASASVLLVNMQSWFPLELTGWISMLSVCREPPGVRPNRDKVTGRERNLQGSSSSHGAAPGAQYVPAGAAGTRKELARQLFP